MSVDPHAPARTAGRVILLTLLPTSLNERIRRLIPNAEVRSSTSWSHLGQSIDREEIDAVVFDPVSHGGMSADDVDVLRRHPWTFFLAYVNLTPESLKAVFELSKVGLDYVFVKSSSESDHRFVAALELARERRIIVDLLATVEAGVARLPTNLILVVEDLLRRPQFYNTVADIARAAHLPAKKVNRDFADAGLSSPKKVVLLAKAVHAYAHLRVFRLSVRCVSTTIGCSSTRVMAQQIGQIFNCSPTQLRGGSHDEFFLRLIEWINKPTHFRGKRPLTRLGFGRNSEGSVKTGSS